MSIGMVSFTIEKMTALEWTFYEGESIEGQSHWCVSSRKCSWSSNTPNSVDIMSIYEVMYMLGKNIIVFSLGVVEVYRN